MRPEWHFPTKNFQINQGWGILNSFYEQFGFSRHNGVDYPLAPDKTVHYPWSCWGTVWKIETQTGGGNIIGILSDEVDFMGTKCRILTDFLHLQEAKLKVGDRVRTGDVVAIADNTGTATSGPHTHEQDRRVILVVGQLQTIDTNQANNSFDPLIFKSGLFAEDVGTWRNLLQKLANWLASLKGR